MRIDFHKYQATGNDFVLLNDMDDRYRVIDAAYAPGLCHRRFGVGADGLILLRKDPELDFRMDHYNVDGSQSFCGNGSRCAVAFAVKKGICGERCRFRAIDGAHEALFVDDIVRLSMGSVQYVERGNDHFFIDTGSPHFIRYVANVDAVDVEREGRVIRYSKPYREGGTNVNFVQWTPEGIRMRTYERGVEGETFSCGTGVTAAALSAASSDERVNGSCQVSTRGGELSVSFEEKDGAFEDIWLNGPAEAVFSGWVHV